MKLSIIIPVYNNASYLKRCLDSLLAQTFTDFELIVVDDGSSDGSSVVAEEILAGRSHIQVVTKDNGGVSSARNMGMSVASGTYITFIDSDDYVASDFVESLINAIDGYDFLMSGTSYMTEGRVLRVNVPQQDVWTIEDLKNGKASYLDYTTAIHGKLYKKYIIDKFTIRFDERISFAEDRDFNIEYISHISEGRNISYTGYFYQTDVDGSLSTKYYPYKFKNDILYWNKVYRLLGDSDLRYLAHQLYYFIVDNYAFNKKNAGICNAMWGLYKVRTYVNGKFILRHIGHVDAPSWQKLMVFNYGIIS